MNDIRGIPESVTLLECGRICVSRLWNLPETMDVVGGREEVGGIESENHKRTTLRESAFIIFEGCAFKHFVQSRQVKYVQKNLGDLGCQDRSESTHDAHHGIEGRRGCGGHVHRFDEDRDGVQQIEQNAGIRDQSGDVGQTLSSLTNQSNENDKLEKTAKYG